MNSKLFFFTGEYPYGNVSETFIENEIAFLSESFSEVIIFPSSRSNDIIRELPQNVSVCNVFIDNSIYSKRKILFKCFFKIFSTFIFEIFIKSNLKYYLKNWKYYIDFLIIQSNRYLELRKYFKVNPIKQDDVFYDFWYINSSVALSFLRKSGLRNKIVLRAHRYDLYDDQWFTHRIPFRNFIYKHASNIVFSNTHGYNYFIEKIKKINLNKLSIHYLGVYDKNSIPGAQKIKHDDFVIVSCSGVTPRKRVDIIPEILSKLPYNITWFHFGDGLLLEKIKDRAKNLPDNIKCVFKGHIDNKEVLEFYQKNHIDLFMSFTLSEGLPVSFKEVISFGIPILSTDVCGIPDIVNQTTGVLVKVDEEIDNIVKIMERIINFYPFNEIEIRQFLKENFLANKVYPNFINSILLANMT